MKAYMLFTGSGPLVILTSHSSILEPGLRAKLTAKGIPRFIAYELSVELARKRYGHHFAMAVNDLHDTEDLRVLDYNGQRAFRLFHLTELVGPILSEHDPAEHWHPEYWIGADEEMVAAQGEDKAFKYD